MRRRIIRGFVLAAFAGCARAPQPAPADAPPPVEETASLDGTVVRGTVLLQDRHPAPDADVYVGVAEGAAGDPGGCERPGALLALARTSPGADGRWATRLPRPEPGAGTPACLFIAAEVRDTTGRVRDQVRAHAWTGVPIDSTNVALVLETVRPSPPGRNPMERRPDWVWIGVAERIPGWAGFIFAQGGCRVIVSLTDLRQQAAARAYVDSVLRAERGGPPRGCPAEREYEFRRVDYDWAQLQRWYGRAGLLGSFRGMQSSDVDEARNRLVFRFRDPGGARAARRALPLLRVPAEAVIIEAPEEPRDREQGIGNRE